MNCQGATAKICLANQNHRYWETTISGAFIVPSRTSILETIPKVIAQPPKISSKSSTGAVQRVFFGLRGASTSHPYLSLGLLIGILVGVGVWSKRVRRGKGFFTLDGKEGLLNGGGAYGKTD